MQFHDVFLLILDLVSYMIIAELCNNDCAFIESVQFHYIMFMSDITGMCVNHSQSLIILPYWVIAM